ncbi:MAG: radical SAM protein [bacterium]
MKSPKFKYLYGPIWSWRVGNSLGIDLLSQNEKSCVFNCIYCQVGNVCEYTKKRKIYVPTKDIIAEIKALPDVDIDYMTFSGRGEPTLALNLGEVIRELRKIRKEPVAVLTNSALIEKKDVREDLALADFVMCKLDGASQQALDSVDRPAPGIKIENIVKGIKDFRGEFKKKLALQIMLMEENKGEVGELARLAMDIRPDEIQINTPLRPGGAKPLARDEIEDIKKNFNDILQGKIRIVTVYDKEPSRVSPMDEEQIINRRKGEI